ncbi:ANTAR domain-containing protein [Streptomyces sclerotialus]|uniref:ANTAR domain-containing protein n=1 Tax=Streptomyces sclerotialus TaxID=1957 RepID=UPI0006909E07
MAAQGSAGVREPGPAEDERYARAMTRAYVLLERSLNTCERTRQVRAEARRTRQQTRQARLRAQQMRQRALEMRLAWPTAEFSAVLRDFDLSSPPLRECAARMGLDGLAVLLAPGDRPPEAVHCCGALTVLLEDLQYVYGQGPSYDVAQSGRMVMVSDLSALSADTSADWAGLLSAMQKLGVAAVFAFPLRLGQDTFGVLIGHRKVPGPVSPGQLRNGLLLADALARAVARAAEDDTDWLAGVDHLPFAAVHRAVGMLAQRLGISPEHALLRLRAHAFRHGRTLLGTAHAALRNGTRFDDDGECPPGTCPGGPVRE